MLGGMDRTTTTRAQRIGDAAEQLVAERLVAAGWLILGRNVRVGRDELDLVGVDPGPPRSLVVVEVRMRSRRDFGVAEETLDHRKRAALRRAIGVLRACGALPDGTALPSLSLRVDLVAIDEGLDGRASIRHHRGISP
jgi:putative endonuclease